VAEAQRKTLEASNAFKKKLVCGAAVASGLSYLAYRVKQAGVCGGKQSETSQDEANSKEEGKLAEKGLDATKPGSGSKTSESDDSDDTPEKHWVYGFLVGLAVLGFFCGIAAIGTIVHKAVFSRGVRAEPECVDGPAMENPAVLELEEIVIHHADQPDLVVNVDASSLSTKPVLASSFSTQKYCLLTGARRIAAIHKKRQLTSPKFKPNNISGRQLATWNEEASVASGDEKPILEGSPDGSVKIDRASGSSAASSEGGAMKRTSGGKAHEAMLREKLWDSNRQSHSSEPQG